MSHFLAAVTVEKARKNREVRMCARVARLLDQVGAHDDDWSDSQQGRTGNRKRFAPRCRFEAPREACC